MIRNTGTIHKNTPYYRVTTRREGWGAGNNTKGRKCYSKRKAQSDIINQIKEVRKGEGQKVDNHD